MTEKVKSNRSKKSVKYDHYLDDVKAKRIATCIRAKVNFISGTVTPVQSNKNNHDEQYKYSENDLEHLESGLDFLCEMYTNFTLSVQPKFMGCRCNMYLFRDDYLTKSYCVTRNGYICNISREKLKPLYETMRTRLDKFMTDKNIRLIILDGELLPWSVLGTNLIENEYMPVDKGLETEISYSNKFDFDSQFLKIKESLNRSSINCNKMRELLEVPDTTSSQKMYDVYHKQMCLYAGKDKKLEYKAFGILKICFNDDNNTESIPLVDKTYSQGEMYDLVRDPDCKEDEQLLIKIDEKNYHESVKTIRQYFEKLTYEKGFEGIVMKPDYVINGLLPMMKCRNTSYLSIIYGYDYKTEPKLSRLVTKKSTKSKIKHSVREFLLGMEMLKIKYGEINTDKNYGKVVLKFIYDEEDSTKLDPRL